MARKKVKLAWIANDAARKSSMKKRRMSLLKKVKELSILCGVETFCIVYSPTDVNEPDRHHHHHHHDHPMVWPPDQDEARRVLTRYLAMPEYDRSKGMTNQESYLRDQINKLQARREKHLKLVKELELEYLMDEAVNGENGVEGLGVAGLDRLGFLVREKVREIRERVDDERLKLRAGVGPGVGKREKREAEGHVRKKAKRTASFGDGVVEGNGVVSESAVTSAPFSGEVEGNGVVSESFVADVPAERGEGSGGGDLDDAAAGLFGGGCTSDGYGFSGGDLQLRPPDDDTDNDVWSDGGGAFPPLE